MERYLHEDVAVLMYHLHIPAPDPMTNPSTVARAEFYEARGTPTYAIDGELASGGGSREETKGCYDRINAGIEKRLQVPAAARLALEASRAAGKVTARIAVDRLTGNSSDLVLHVALVEELVSYSGENGARFHPMVVRSLAGEEGAGFVLKPHEARAIEHAFDLAKITDESKAHLEAFEKERKTAFHSKKHEMNVGKLAVAAFVQDRKSREVLQAAFTSVKAD